ncbi:hypothetical protein [Pseudoroseicyclus aestuarii]|uniref:Uncharacterized protein n=1 Tax=Pseudoroseicyclus aestuarii TaxID=1795041 RepID=A0A318SSV4_9RHOB|nr:hypothetical protein [Pseudoroseicyclus aestuarii]PYE82229.1 hypothetical protein DFP88_10569 [Pseudoroseicyclus aestuarii]
MLISLMLGQGALAQTAGAPAPAPGGTIGSGGVVDPDTATGSLAFPQDNALAGVETALVLRQPAQDGWFRMWDGDGALFAVVRIPPESSYRNEEYRIVDGIAKPGQESFLRFYGGAMGLSDKRRRFRGQLATSGIQPESAPLTEDAALVVFRREGRRAYVDWYSLQDGARHAGEGDGTIYQSQPVPSDPTGYEIYVGADTAEAGTGTAWPGEVAMVGYVDGAIPEEDWRAIALGTDPAAVLPVETLRWFRAFDGTEASLAAPDWATADRTLPMSPWGGAGLRPGSDFLRQDRDRWLLPDILDDGMVFGLAPGETARSVRFSGTAKGRSGTVEVRVFDQATGEVVLDWTALGPVGDGWSGSVTVPKSSGGWVAAQVRTTDDPEDVVDMRSRWGVGYKIMQLGQSQTSIYLESSALGLAPVSRGTASYVTTDVPTGNAPQMQVEMLGAWPRDGLGAFLDQLRVFDPATPIMVIDAAINGTGPDQLMDDGDSGRDWAILQEKLDHVGNDVSVVVMNWATQGWRDSQNDAAETLEALIHGTGGYAAQSDHSLDAALRPGYGFALSPASRQSTGGHEAVRMEQIAYAHTDPVVTVGPPVADFHIGGDGTHQSSSYDGNGQNPNRIFGQRQAIAVAGALSLPGVPQHPHFTGAARDEETLTVSVALPNGGHLTAPGPLRNWEVSEGTGWSSTGFTAAISGNAVALTKDEGAWPPGVRVRYLANGEQRRDPTDASQEAAVIAGMLYESWDGDVLGLGMPVMGQVQDGQWMPEFTATAP